MELLKPGFLFVFSIVITIVIDRLISTKAAVIVAIILLLIGSFIFRRELLDFYLGVRPFLLTNRVLASLGCGVFGALFFGVGAFYFIGIDPTVLPKKEEATQKVEQTEAPAKNSPPVSTTAPDANFIPNLLVKYVPAKLPIEIPRNGTVYVLPLNPKLLPFGLDLIENKKRKTILWPPNLKVGKNIDPELAFICEITNPDGARNLLNVSITFNIDYHKPRFDSGLIKTNPDGTTSLSLSMNPDSAHPNQVWASFQRTINGKRMAFTVGDLDSSVPHTISIPEIKAGEKVSIYLINKSKYLTKFELPTDGTVTPTTGMKVHAELIRPKLGASDLFPGFILPPAEYHWKNVPDAP